MVSIFTVGLSLRLLCPDLSDSSSLTQRTSDNQRLGTSKFYDTTSVAKGLTEIAGLDIDGRLWAIDYNILTQ